MTSVWAYSRGLNPPSPIVEARLFKPWATSGTSITETLQVDSGADMSGIPMSSIDRLDARLVDWSEAFDFDDNLVEDLPIYEIGIEIIGVTFSSIKVYGLTSDLGFIGRDLLNSFYVTLDGPGRLSGFA